MEKYAWASLHRLRVDLLEMLVKMLAGSEQLSLAAAVRLVSGPGWREAHCPLLGLLMRGLAWVRRALVAKKRAGRATPIQASATHG